jgi:hypothetical protein
MNARSVPPILLVNAIMIAKIATGEIDDITTEDGKNAGADRWRK